VESRRRLRASKKRRREGREGRGGEQGKRGELAEGEGKEGDDRKREGLTLLLCLHLKERRIVS